MRISIRDEVFQDDTNWRYLDRIISKVADDWHEWDISELAAIEMSGWLSGRLWLREIFQKAALAASFRSNSHFPKRRVIVSIKKELGSLGPEAAARFVEKPLVLLMENRFTDGLFIDTLLDFMAPQGVKQVRERAPNAICYDSPGGNGELPKLIRDYVEKTQQEDIPLRLVVFTDSDGTVPGEISKDALNIKKICDDASIPCMILSKRAIENYIPDEVLNAWLTYSGGKKSCAEVLMLLNKHQRDHYPMKKGIDWDRALPQVRSLYETVSETDLKELRHGFGGEVINALRDYKHALSAEALSCRDGKGELDYLVTMIAGEL
jgi:hypothetical protein